MKGVIIAQKKWICHIPQNVEKEESPWNGHKEKSLCAKSNRQPGPKKSKTDDFDEAKISDLSLCFSWRVFGLRLTHLTHSFPSQGDLSLEFSRTSLLSVIFEKGVKLTNAITYVLYQTRYYASLIWCSVGKVFEHREEMALSIKLGGRHHES